MKETALLDTLRQLFVAFSSPALHNGQHYTPKGIKKISSARERGWELDAQAELSTPSHDRTYREPSFRTWENTMRMIRHKLTISVGQCFIAEKHGHFLAHTSFEELFLARTYV
jgi:hypothetical protein